jgi:hypothetical protein
MKPTVPEALPLAQAIYARHAGGCCFHILLDDGNCDRSDIAFCCEWAREKGHPDCIALAEKMQHMSPTQARKLASRAHGMYA